MKKKTYKTAYDNFILHSKLYRLAAVLFMISGGVYLFWLLRHFNMNQFLIAFGFFAAQAFNYFAVSLSMINHWSARYRTKSPDITGAPPPVAVVVPVYKEPISVIKKTLTSIASIQYDGEVIVIVSNDYNSAEYIQKLENLIRSVSLSTDIRFILRTSTPHTHAKAGNLNQALTFLRSYFPHIDLMLTQDADEIVYPHILNSLVGYFCENPKLAYVQSIKQAKVPKSDPFGNNDYMWYGRTAPAKDHANAMFACGSGVIWRASALEEIGGFDTWNLVEDLTTSYNLLASGWDSAYHYEALSKGLAPEDLANFVKQRGTWALDTMRLFFWDNPLFKKGLNLRQKLQFLEVPIFYLNGSLLLVLVFITSLSMIFEAWPTNATAIEHAAYLLPSFIFLEVYYITLAGKIPMYRTRQYWIGLAPIFAQSTLKALFYGPHKKPSYKVTRKENAYGNYLRLAVPQLVVLAIVAASIAKSIFATPIYSAFDWAVFFWGLYIASFFLQFVRVSTWKWNYSLNLSSFGFHKKVSLSYTPDTL